jgi:hypothetical protein
MEELKVDVEHAPEKSYRVLVCGGREFGQVPKSVVLYEEIVAAMQIADAEKALLRQSLDNLRRTINIECIIEGGARGADRLASKWAEKNGISNQTFYVTKEDWEKQGKAAGHLRNTKMLEEGKPSLVVAFPGGRGTKNMVEQAKAAGIPVFEVTFNESD